MPVLNYQQVNMYLQEMTDTVQYIEPEFYQFLKYNYDFGFRYKELKESSRWSYHENETFLVNTEKGSNDRIVPIDGVPKAFIESINDQTEGFSTIRYSTFTRLFKKYYFYPYLSVGNKKVSSHIFRYLLVKRLSLQGQTIRQISDFIGEVNTNNTLGYLNAVFHY